jgi:hypothetical protein
MTETKKQKVDWKEVATGLWEHYRNYLDSLAESEDQGDIDELQELIEEVQSSYDIKPSESTTWKDVEEMIPILVSVAYYHLTDAKISEYLATSGGDELALEIQTLISKSLEYYPLNSASWSMGANFGRMTQCLSPMSTLEWYEQAIAPLATIKRNAFAILENEDVDGAVKEWIELLVLNQVLGIEFEEEEGNEENGDDEENEKKDDSENIQEEEEEEEEADGHYSASAVEATSRFMSATLYSMIQQHDRALVHLKRFPLTHRLHPNVWKPAKLTSNDEAPTRAPLAFQPSSGILPESLYNAMTTVFAPQSRYWSDSDYSNRGYYSYFINYEKGQRPTNLVEEVIINHLLPRAQQALDKQEADSICGFEWWTHTRPIQANLGHNLHFDTDESMLAQEKQVTHPISSSVLYLTGGGNEAGGGGPTIVLDQTPDSETLPESCWLAVPKDNSLLLFPGNLLHGVLPCPGQHHSDQPIDVEQKKTRQELMVSWDKSRRNGDKSAEPPHRLTFMVGFWTRDVPSTMKERRLYGPCGSLPPSTEEHSWVGEIQEGYGSTETSLSPVAETPVATTALPKVSPVWEVVKPEEATENEPELQTPRAIDHRFFVHGVPKCFRDSLFEEDDGDCE